MAVLFSQKVWDGGVSGSASTTVYTSSEFNELLATAEKYLVFARVTQASGTSVALSVSLEHSNDGQTFTEKFKPVNNQSVSSNTINNFFGTDAGSTPGGCFVRAAITLLGTNPNGYVEIWITGRSLD